MNKDKIIFTKEEFSNIIERILREIKTQRKYNNNEDEWVKLDDVIVQVSKRYGNNWEVAE